ncbi:MAG: hypothetical protein AB2A00_25285, partial [Myxococcota bacterium]
MTEEQKAAIKKATEDAFAADDRSFLQRHYLGFKPPFDELHPDLEKQKIVLLAFTTLGQSFMFANWWGPLVLIKPPMKVDWGTVIMHVIKNLLLEFGLLIPVLLLWFVIGIFPFPYFGWYIGYFIFLGYCIYKFYWMGGLSVLRFWNNLYKIEMERGIIKPEGGAAPAATTNDAAAAEAAKKAEEEAKAAEEA